MILVATRDSLGEFSLSSHCSKNSQFSIFNSQLYNWGLTPFVSFFTHGTYTTTICSVSGCYMYLRHP